MQKIINYEKIVETISNALYYNMKIHIIITMMAMIMANVKIKVIKTMWSDV